MDDRLYEAIMDYVCRQLPMIHDLRDAKAFYDGFKKNPPNTKLKARRLHGDPAKAYRYMIAHFYWEAVHYHGLEGTALRYINKRLRKLKAGALNSRHAFKGEERERMVWTEVEGRMFHEFWG